MDRRTLTAAALSAALLMTALPAQAVPVTYFTTAVLSGPDASGGNLVSGGATVSFSGVPSTTVDAPTNLAFGEVTLAGGTGTFAGDLLDLTITQTAPAGGTGMTSSTVVGKITSTSSTIDLTFAPTSLLIGGSTFTFAFGGQFILVPPNDHGGNTSIQGKVVSSIPEPATLSLLGLGLVAVGALRRRKPR